jgi:TRAP-type uncharacterized transport system substrate-binding protein
MNLRNRVSESLKRWGILVLGFAAMSLAVAAFLHIQDRSQPITVVMSTGGTRGLRHQLLDTLAVEAESHGLRVRVEIVPDRDEVLRRVADGRIDFAMLQGGFDLSKHPLLRQVASLHVEPLHLLVKQEIHAEVLASLGALRGKVINLGESPSTAAYWLAQEVLSFAGLHPPSGASPGDYVPRTGPAAEFLRLHDRQRLPDAIFLISTPPAPTVWQLVTVLDYRLVPIPFGQAFGLSALREPGEHSKSSAHSRPTDPLLKEHIADVVIPAYTYGVNPPVPPSDLHTLGTRVLLLTHPRTSSEAVQRVLDAIFSTRFAKLVNPPLSVSILAQLPEAPWHPGTIRYIEQDKPLITGELIGTLANAFTIGAPLLGSAFCFWQWLRQRSRARREQSFETYILKIAMLERQAIDLQQAPAILRDDLVRIERELGQVKVEALEQFSRGELGDIELMASFLAHVNDTRSFLNNLMRQAQSKPSIDPGTSNLPDGQDSSSPEP